MSNYPDDIRNYDDHPGSPFYIEPWIMCEVCEAIYPPDEMEDAMCVSCAGVDEGLTQRYGMQTETITRRKL